MLNQPLPRIDKDKELKTLLSKYTRFEKGFIWEDPEGKHKIACIDAADDVDLQKLFKSQKAKLAIQDPPYNFIAFDINSPQEFVNWSKDWVENTYKFLDDNSALYIWLGADYKNHFEPFASFIKMMSETAFSSKNFITMRNQRGYGTQKNWMSVRQELLYYIKGNPVFNIKNVYTEIPKTLTKGYYKAVNGKMTDNSERSKAPTIRAGNVWIDIQQVFYRMEENVNGCYAQKPLKAIDRIISVSSNEGDIVTDFFSHSGTSLISAEKLGRRCFTVDIDPIYCEISLRRLENLRNNELYGWQNSNPFAEEISRDEELQEYLFENYKIDYENLTL
jgi:site-specific DNA-methyltransferase (adenine-specific)